MKGLCLILMVALAGQFAFCKQQLNFKIPEHTNLTTEMPSKLPTERRLNFDDELQTGSLYVQQLENTNANLSEMTGHSRRQRNMKLIADLFGQVEEKLDDFRDHVGRKLNELHMSLQRPKVPIMGPAAMMLHPSMNPIVSSALNGGSNFMPNPVSMMGPRIQHEYASPITTGSQVIAAPMRSDVGSVQSSFLQSGIERRLRQQNGGLNNKRVL